MRQGHHVSSVAYDGSGQQRVTCKSLYLLFSCLIKKLLQGLDLDWMMFKLLEKRKWKLAVSIWSEQGQSSIFPVIKTVGDRKEKVSEGQRALVPHFVKMNVAHHGYDNHKKFHLETFIQEYSTIPDENVCTKALWWWGQIA